MSKKKDNPLATNLEEEFNKTREDFEDGRLNLSGSTANTSVDDKNGSISFFSRSMSWAGSVFGFGKNPELSLSILEDDKMHSDLIHGDEGQEDGSGVPDSSSNDSFDSVTNRVGDGNNDIDPAQSNVSPARHSHRQSVRTFPLTPEQLQDLGMTSENTGKDDKAVLGSSSEEKREVSDSPHRQSSQGVDAPVGVIAVDDSNQESTDRIALSDVDAKLPGNGDVVVDGEKEKKGWLSRLFGLKGNNPAVDTSFSTIYKKLNSSVFEYEQEGTDSKKHARSNKRNTVTQVVGREQKKDPDEKTASPRPAIIPGNQKHSNPLKSSHSTLGSSRRNVHFDFPESVKTDPDQGNDDVGQRSHSTPPDMSDTFNTTADTPDDRKTRRSNALERQLKERQEARKKPQEKRDKASIDVEGDSPVPIGVADDEGVIGGNGEGSFAPVGNSNPTSGGANLDDDKEERFSGIGGTSGDMFGTNTTAQHSEEDGAAAGGGDGNGEGSTEIDSDDDVRSVVSDRQDSIEDGEPKYTISERNNKWFSGVQSLLAAMGALIGRVGGGTTPIPGGGGVASGDAQNEKWYNKIYSSLTTWDIDLLDRPIEWAKKHPVKTTVGMATGIAIAGGLTFVVAVGTGLGCYYGAKGCYYGAQGIGAASSSVFSYVKNKMTRSRGSDYLAGGDDDSSVDQGSVDNGSARLASGGINRRDVRQNSNRYERYLYENNNGYLGVVDKIDDVLDGNILMEFHGKKKNRVFQFPDEVSFPVSSRGVGDNKSIWDGTSRGTKAKISCDYSGDIDDRGFSVLYNNINEKIFGALNYANSRFSEQFNQDQIIKIIKYARANGGVSSKYDDSQDKYIANYNNAEIFNIAFEGPYNPASQDHQQKVTSIRLFSKYYQEAMAQKDDQSGISITSGRQGSNVGLRLTFIGDDILESLELSAKQPPLSQSQLQQSQPNEQLQRSNPDPSAITAPRVNKAETVVAKPGVRGRSNSLP